MPPSTGIFYPWVAGVLARRLRALVIQPEHRFYGESLPAGPPPFSPDALLLLTPEQAMLDAVHLVQAQQRRLNCTARGTARYCPVLTVGGSYPGFLSAMLRLRYPAVVDVAYAASAPLTFYAQEVEQHAYYAKVTQSAERSLPGCAAALRTTFAALVALSTAEEVVEGLGLCTPLPAYLRGSGRLELLREEVLMVFMVMFAGLNMGNYPPTNTTGLHAACASLVAAPTLRSLADLLSTHAAALAASGHRRRPDAWALPPAPSTPSTRAACFDLTAALPAGRNATISSGDWSGVGSGADGQAWDYQTCSLLVEKIGTNNVSDAFPARTWRMDWLEAHCRARFGVVPSPTALSDFWGFSSRQLVAAGASKIVFTNGLNDGWSVGSVTTSLSDELVAINMPNGAHHSDLSHAPPSDLDTPDVVAARAQAADLIARWLPRVS